LELDPANPRRYRTPSGWQEFQQFAETIRVRGGTNVELAVAETIWGPVVTRGKTQFALACTLHEAQAINLRSIEMERERDMDTVLRVSGLAGTPVLNFIVGDRAGNIGYSVLGRLPNRVGFDGSTPSSWADGTRGWQGWVPAEDYPRFVNPSNGILWTANNRTLGSPAYNRLHICSADNGARAGQIRDDLLALEKPTEQTLWAIYRDDRALFLDRWQKLMPIFNTVILYLSVVERVTRTHIGVWHYIRRPPYHPQDWEDGGSASCNTGGKARPTARNTAAQEP